MVLRRIRDLREDNDLTQGQLAKELYCCLGTYAKYERGEIKVSIEVLCYLADFYKVSVDYILMRTDDPTPPKKRR